MGGGWHQQRIVITVTTYPVPAKKGIEVSCTGGITDDYRFLDGDKRFKRYEWIKVSVKKASNDPRPESFNLNGESISTANEWRARRELIKPLSRQSMCQIRREGEIIILFKEPRAVLPSPPEIVLNID